MLRTIYQDVLMMAAGRGGGGGGRGGSRGGSSSGGSRGGSKTGGSKTGGSKTGGSKTGGSKTGGSKPGGSKPGGSKPGGSKPGGSKPGGSKPGGSKPAPKPPAPKPPAPKPPAPKPPAPKPPAPKPPAPKPTPKPSGKRGLLGRLLDFLESFAKKRNKTVQDRAEKAIRDKQLQRVKELHGLFDKSNPVNHLTIGGHRIDLGPEGRPYGTAKVFNSQKLTDKQIRDFAQELAGGEKMKQVRPGIGIYTAKLDDGTSVTLRDVSTSKDLTGARWTMDVRENPDLKNLAPKYNKVEIKFK